MKTLQFIQALNLSTTTMNYLQTGNISDIAVINIEAEKDKKGKIIGYSFTEVTDFYLIENITLKTSELFANEIFRNFKNNKNAVASVLWAIENDKPMDADLFATQHLKSPKREDWKSLKTFGQLWNVLTDEQRKSFAEKAKGWAELEGLDQHEFEAFYISQEGDGLTAGTFIKILDPINNKPIFGKIIQAMVGGFVTVYNGDNTYTLSQGAMQYVKTVEMEGLPKDWKQALTGDAIDWFMADVQDRRDKGLEKGEKLHNLAIATAEKEKAKAEKEAQKQKANAESDKLTGRLEKIALTDSEKIKKFAESLNAKRTILTKDDYKKLSEKLKGAKAEQKAILENQKAEAKAQKEAEKAKKQAEATKETAKPARKPRKKAETIAEIIEEDSKSDNPIL